MLKANKVFKSKSPGAKMIFGVLEFALSSMSWTVLSQELDECFRLVLPLQNRNKIDTMTSQVCKQTLDKMMQFHQDNTKMPPRMEIKLLVQ